MINNRKIHYYKNSDPIEYLTAINKMDEIVDNIINGKTNEVLWFLEHPSVYTAGTSSKNKDLLNDGLFPIIQTGRGGQYTYHGPGQRVIYVMINLAYYKKDVRQYVKYLEKWLINSLFRFGIDAKAHCGRIGIWVDEKKEGLVQEKKIAAIGVRIRRWVSLHGISLNISPNLQNYKGIVPCGLNEYGVTSIKNLGLSVENELIDKILIEEFEKIFKVFIEHKQELVIR
ncbi:MAG: hypothetical protein CBC47_07760 [Alphaproteobacteria bacterium TMED87]|nr:lipoate-protein ligase B [Rhodospirillaceae bacterium]OUV08353.1 MAG: hypothetical protein CBC47_07760 [Alphaproteobacteria bacterium TMED87]